MIFSELYSAYFKTIAAILTAAVKYPLQKSELTDVIRKNAFSESVLNIGPAIGQERWQVLHADGTTPLRHVPDMPLTTLEKRWMKAIALDPRMKLFADDIPDYPDTVPLFQPEDVTVFDRYADGDPYGNAAYIENFRLILDAIKNRYPLRLCAANSKGTRTPIVLLPEYLEYSEKDDKFRVIGSGDGGGRTVNLARIVSCRPFRKPFKVNAGNRKKRKSRKVIFELVDQRNALERVLLHFAHFEKQAEKITDDRYQVTISYDKDDETEIVIRLLSFGPMLKVIAPGHFVELIKDRLLSQKSCGH